LNPTEYSKNTKALVRSGPGGPRWTKGGPNRGQSHSRTAF